MNLLTDPIIRVRTPAGTESMNLPQLLAALGKHRVESFPGLQRHQEDAFYVFLCYLAAAILARQGLTEPKQSEDSWREGLQSLAEPFSNEAWTLVVEDLTKPAFMQPPLPKVTWKQLRLAAESPDALDLLPTAKNHDLKRDRAASGGADQWVFALVSLQTMSGYFGRGNPGIARMNSGFGNRPIVEVAHDLRWGPRFCHAIPRLLSHRQTVLKGEWRYHPKGLVLTWLESWDGTTALELNRLDPFFVEICRRVRLIGKPMRAFSIPSNSNRIAAKNLKGIVGDAWLPIEVGEEEKALTLSGQGWTPDLLRRLLFEENFLLTPLHRPLEGTEGPLWLIASVLVRGQGTTDGFHERRILVPPQARKRLFASPQKRASLQSLSRNAIEYAGKIQNNVLKPAVLAFLQAGPERIRFDDAVAQAFWKRFQRSFEIAWSDSFFPWLWSVPDPLKEEAALRDWAKMLKGLAYQILLEAEKSLPTPEGRTYRARTAAERVFFASLYRNFPQLKEGLHAI